MRGKERNRMSGSSFQQLKWFYHHFGRDHLCSQLHTDTSAYPPKTRTPPASSTRWRAFLRRLRPGDVLVILSIDRLGRNYEEILEQWRIITKQKQADIVVLDFPLLDTRERQDGSDLTGRFVADLVLQILAYTAEKERENIRCRQAEGIAAAKARGVTWGRKKIARPPEADHYAQLWKEGAIGLCEIGARLGVSRSTAYRLGAARIKFS